eukprot:SAG11_NODE_22886_length_398_cov_1.555184_1_plen_58_part_10
MKTRTNSTIFDCQRACDGAARGGGDPPRSPGVARAGEHNTEKDALAIDSLVRARAAVA